MTLEIIEYRCPTCTQIIGEEEYRRACNSLEKKVQEISKERIQEQEIRHRKETQQQETKHNHELQVKVNHEVEVQRNKILLEQVAKWKNEKAVLTEKYENEITEKNKELEAAKSQGAMDVEKKIEEARIDKEVQYRQKEIQFNLQFNRIQKQNGELIDQVQKLQQTLENIPPEFRGTVGELMLFEELHAAFRQDDLVIKKVGVEMPDIVQTIVTASGERISTPILWDIKTGANITPTDIEKAKKYKEKYNTDHCIIVTAKGITSKDSKGYRISIIGKRENVLLIHPKMAVSMAELMRNFIIEKTQIVKNIDGRTSKEVKLYDYITSSVRFRKKREKIEKKLKLDELARKEETYLKKTWAERKDLIQKWYDLDVEDQNSLDAITQEEQDLQQVDVQGRINNDG